MVVVIALVLLALVILAVILLRGGRNSASDSRAAGNPHMVGGNTADHSEEDIARSLEANWPVLIDQHYELIKKYGGGEEEAEALAQTEFEIIEVHRLSEDAASALARTEANFADLPVWARALLLGSRVDQAGEVEASRRQLAGDDLPSNLMLIYCRFENGQWKIVGLQDESWNADENLYGDHLVTGESVQLQMDRKQPPFAILVLGPPEAVNDIMLQVPVRVTSIIPRWSYDDVGGFYPTLVSSLGQDGDYFSWTTFHPNLPADSFRGVTLVKGGSHDGHIYFFPDEEKDKSSQIHQLVKLEFLDITEALVDVDLTRSVPPTERVRFDNGVPVTPAVIRGVGQRLRGSEWSELRDPPTFQMGDTASVDDESGEVLYDLTVLDPPEPFGENSVRLRLRITN